MIEKCVIDFEFEFLRIDYQINTYLSFALTLVIQVMKSFGLTIMKLVHLLFLSILFISYHFNSNLYSYH